MNDKEIKAKTATSWNHGAHEYNTIISHGIKTYEEKISGFRNFQQFFPDKPIKGAGYRMRNGRYGATSCEDGTQHHRS